MHPSKSLAARNRNPLNLRPIGKDVGGPWLGQVGVSENATSGRFAVFDTDVHGVRAAVVNMRAIMRPERCAITKAVGGRLERIEVGRTLERLIYVWAPPNEPMGGNHTEAYLEAVGSAAQVDRHFDMTWLITATSADDDPRLVDIVLEMNRVEAGGATIDRGGARDGIEAALGVPQGYVRSDDGNLRRVDIGASEIVKKADAGQVATTVGTVVGASAPVATAFLGADWKVALVFAVLVVVAGALGLLYLKGIRERRIDMHEQGTA